MFKLIVWGIILILALCLAICLGVDYWLKEIKRKRDLKRSARRKAQTALAQRERQARRVVPYICKYSHHPPHRNKTECDSQLNMERLVREWEPPKSL